MNFPSICSNFPAAPTYGVYISLDAIFLDRSLVKFLLAKLNSSLGKLYGRYHDLVDHYGISVSQITTDMFHLS